MKRSYLVLGSVALAALGLAYLVTLPTETAEASITLKPNEPAVVSLGKEVYAQNCASCHGVALEGCLLYTSPSPRDYAASRMPSSA